MDQRREKHRETSAFYAGVELLGTVGTMYNDRRDVRFEVAIDTAERYQAAGLPLIVVDNSAPEDAWVKAAFDQRKAIVLRANIGGIATQRKQGVEYAIKHGAQKIVGHEPEKSLMVEFAPEISTALESCDVLVIGRTQQAEDSLPSVQQRTERLAGWLLEKTLKLPHDALSGGRGFTVAGADCLKAYPATKEGMNNWIYLYDTLLEAQARGLQVGGILIDLMHPTSLVAEETNNPLFDAKRYMQFNLQLRYLLNRPEVEVESTDLARIVQRDLEDLPVIAVPDDIPAYEAFFNGLEGMTEALGYVPAQR